MQDVQATLPAGSIVQERYVVERLLGQGGFGAVYLVRDARSSRNLFALKELVDPDKKEHSRFIFESELLKHLDHRSLPRVYRVFKDKTHGRAYMLMDYIEGLNLEKLRQQQPENRFTLPQVLTFMAPIIDAVAYLHKQQPPVIHRDIKPSNIIIPANGEDAVLVDLGIAKQYDPDSTTTAVRHCSPGYAALEQYSKGTNPRTDIYGLAATIYNLLTGTIPADAFHRMVQLDTDGTEPLDPVNLLAPAVPQQIADAIYKAMSLSSKDRFATVEEFWQALDAVPIAHPLIAPPIPLADQPMPAPAQTPLSAVAALAPATPLPPLPALLSVTPAPTPPPVAVSRKQRRRAPRLRVLVPLFLILLALLVVLGSASGLWSYLLTTITRPTARTTTPAQPTATMLPSPVPTLLPTVKATPVPSNHHHHRPVAPTPQPTTITVPPPASGPPAYPPPAPTPPPAPRPAPTPTPAPVVYPKVIGNYSGSIDDTTANITTSMALAIQQERSEGEITGYFTVGSPLVGSGPFSGSVTVDNHIQFIVPRHKNIAPLFFYGWVQSDGSLKGDYCSLNSHNQCDPAAGASGTWVVIPA